MNYEIPEIKLIEEPIELRKARRSDIPEIKKVFDFAKQEKHFDNVMKQHIREGFVILLLHKHKIIGLSAYRIGTRNRVSLTYYWVAPKHRNKTYVWALYMATFPALKGMEVLIKSKDISTFAKFVEQYNGGNIYKFTGWDMVEEALIQKIESIYGLKLDGIN